jgi:peroxiredoxin
VRRFAWIPLVVACLSVIGSVWISTPACAQAPSVLNKAPDFTAKDFDGKSFHLAELLKDGPVFVDFWTSWCKPCRSEIPELDKLYLKYKDQGFKVLLIAQDDPKTIQKVKGVVAQMKIQSAVLADPNKVVGNAYNVKNYPTSFLIAKDGTVAHFTQGYMRGDEKVLEQKLVGLLGGTGTAGSGDRK